MNRTKNKLIIALVFLVLLLVGLSFVIYKNNLKQKNIYKIREEIFRISSLPSNDNLVKKFEDLSLKQEELKSYLFDKNNPIELIEFVEKLGGSHSLVINVSKVDIVEENINFETNLIGSIDDLKKFVQSLENGPKEINIKNARLSRIIEKDKVLWNLSLTAEAKTK